MKVRWNELVPKLKLLPDICAQDISIQISTLIFLQPASSLLAVAVELFRKTPLKVFLGYMLKIFLKYGDLAEILSNIFSETFSGMCFRVYGNKFWNMLSTLPLDKNRGAQLEASVRMKYGDIYRNTEDR